MIFGIFGMGALSVPPMGSFTPAGAGLFSVGTTAGPIGFKTAGGVSRDIGRSGATVGAARLGAVGRSLGMVVRTRVSAEAIGLKTAGGSLGNISRTGATVGLKIFGKPPGKVVPARAPIGAGVSADVTGLNTTGRTLGNVRTEAAVGTVGLKPTGKTVGNISRTGITTGVAGLRIFGKSLTKTVRAGVTVGVTVGATVGTAVGTTVGTAGPNTADRALGGIISAVVALGSLARPPCKVVCVGCTRGGMVLAPPLPLRAVCIVAVFVGLPSGVGSLRGTVDAVLSATLFLT